MEQLVGATDQAERSSQKIAAWQFSILGTLYFWFVVLTQRFRPRSLVDLELWMVWDWK